jgi:hypothetical protein
MRLLTQGERGKAICEHCGPVTTTYMYKDVPLLETGKLVKDILVGVCDTCNEVASIPAQSTPAIKREREKATRPIEALLPAPYIEVLDLAAYKISSNATTVMRKQLIFFFLHRQRETQSWSADWEMFEQSFGSDVKLPNKRLSFKVSPKMEDDFLTVASFLNMTKTETLKSLILGVKKDILDKEHLSPEIAMLGRMSYA